MSLRGSLSRAEAALVWVSHADTAQIIRIGTPHLVIARVLKAPQIGGDARVEDVKAGSLTVTAS